MTDEEKQLINDARDVAKALNLVSNRAKLLGIELDITTYSTGRIDLKLTRHTVDLEIDFKGFDQNGLAR